MRVLVIPEDFRNDQYMLKPIFDLTYSQNGGVFSMPRAPAASLWRRKPHGIFVRFANSASRTSMLSRGVLKHSTEPAFACARRELADDRALYDNPRCAPSRSKTLAGFARCARYRHVFEGRVSYVHNASIGLQPAIHLMPCSPSADSSSLLAWSAFEVPSPRSDKTCHSEYAS